MQLSVNRTDLMNGLSIVTRALPARTNYPYLEGVMVDAHDNSVTLTASDSNLTIQSVYPAEVKEEGSVILPGRIFTEMIRKLPDGMAEIKVGDNAMARIKCQASRFNLSGMSSVEFPEIPELKGGIRVEIKQKDLRNMISHVIFAIANDDTRPVLTGSLLEIRPDELRFVSLDGYRLSLQCLHEKFDLGEEELVRSIVPGKVMNELSKILEDKEDACAIHIENGHVVFIFGNTTVSTVQLAGEYIDYQKILPTTFKTRAHTERASLEYAIDRASLIAREGKNNLIRLRFDESELTVSSRSEVGDVEDKLPVDMQGDNLDIAFNAKYITDIIHNVTDDEVFMQFNSNVSPCVIVPEEGDSYYYLILPVRYIQ